MKNNSKNSIYLDINTFKYKFVHVDINPLYPAPAKKLKMFYGEFSGEDFKVITETMTTLPEDVQTKIRTFLKNNIKNITSEV